MTLLDDATRHRISEFPPGIVVFAVMRNEIIRLASWLAHYRAIGIRQFFVVDNESTDGTFEALSAQPDVVIMRTSQSYGAAHFGVDWLNEFRAAMPAERWVLFADADELLVYPGWPGRAVADLVAEIEASGCSALWTFMLDMYPSGPIEPRDPPAGADMFMLANHFDATYHFRYPPRKPWEREASHLEIVGGPRLRSLSTLKRELAVTWVDRFLRGQLDRFVDRTPDRFLGLIFRIFPQALPSLFKSPLAKCDPAIRYLNAHDLAGATYFRRNAIICHFKFLGDFSKKVQSEVGRKEHYRRGAEYFRYQQILRRKRELDLRCADSVPFESVAQLERLGLFTEIPVWPPAQAM